MCRLKGIVHCFDLASALSSLNDGRSHGSWLVSATRAAVPVRRPASAALPRREPSRRGPRLNHHHSGGKGQAVIHPKTRIIRLSSRH